MASKKKSRKRPSSNSSITTTTITTATDGGGLGGITTKKQKLHQPHPEDLILFSPDPSDLPNPRPPSLTDEDIHNLLSPYSKDQLITFLSDAAAGDPSLLSKIRSIADKDVSHRKVFVYGLGWDVTRDDLVETFSPFGKIDDCNVVVDKVTGRTKGYGFVLFGDRAGATRALKQPQKKIKNRIASCQFASIGPVGPGGATGGSDTAARKIYVSNVNAEVRPDRLREFFGKFGEIETGPLGYDMVTGKSRGFALFVYKTVEGARKALEEPHKMFEGHQLHCQKAAESSGKGKGLAGVTGPVTVPIPGPAALAAGPGVLGTGASQPVLAAVAAAQNLALISQNPAYGVLLSQNPLMAAALSQTALTQAGLNTAPTATAFAPATLSQIGGTGLGAYGGNASLLGAYGAQSTAGLQGTPFGQTSLGGPTGSYGGMRPYFW